MDYELRTVRQNVSEYKKRKKRVKRQGDFNIFLLVRLEMILLLRMQEMKMMF